VSLTIAVSAEVQRALRLGGPVVALETTLVAHGFPGGRGLVAGRLAEQMVREHGAVPATIGVLDGAVRVGLDDAGLERFAAAGPAARKVGPRDLAPCAVQGALGATTVGGTLAVCGSVGIRFLGTGGIGGVHREFAESLDISADLPQLARTPALVVCSGAKSILDVPATAELLETLGVPVLGWRTSTLPLFFAAEGGPPVSARVSHADESARIAAAHWQLSPACGLLLARPPADGLELTDVINQAVDRVRQAGVRGQAVTPAVLASIGELSGGRSVAVNQRLIADNAALAALVAVAYARLAVTD
jgi:pseudouridylate synthase